MQILITHGTLARTRALTINRWQALAVVCCATVLMMAASIAVYHLLFVKGTPSSWPVVGQWMSSSVRDELAQRERFMRENLDAMAQRVGEMQAKLLRLEAMGERVSGLAGVKPEELQQIQPVQPRPAAPGGQGGPFVDAHTPSFEHLRALVSSLDEAADSHSDLFTMVESRLFEKRLSAVLIPSTRPVDGAVGSGFGFRSDPFTGRAALHTGLDFPAPTGTPVLAAAGGVVRSTDFHSAYGKLLEIDHRNGLVTRYAHNSEILVSVGDVVRRGQRVAKVGTTGRSTGPHLHFEVMIDGVHQDPAKFLAGKGVVPVVAATAPVATRAP